MPGLAKYDSGANRIIEDKKKGGTLKALPNKQAVVRAELLLRRTNEYAICLDSIRDTRMTPDLSAADIVVLPGREPT